MIAPLTATISLAPESPSLDQSALSNDASNSLFFETQEPHQNFQR